MSVSIDVRRTRRDALAPTVVMIDVEGAELQVLSGMLETLRESKAIVLVEVHWLGERVEDFVHEHVEPLGYAVEAHVSVRPDDCARWHAVLRPLA